MINPIDEIKMEEQAFDTIYNNFEGQIPDKDEVMHVLINDCNLKNEFINDNLIQHFIDRF